MTDKMQPAEYAAAKRVVTAEWENCLGTKSSLFGTPYARKMQSICNQLEKLMIQINKDAENSNA